MTDKNKRMLRVIFMGTPDFAVSALRTLAESGNEIVCVLTQPDRPKGRGYETLPSPVRVCAESAGIPVCTPQTLKDAETQDFLRSLSPDLILVAAYGKILPSEILTMPRLGCVNLHASLLPAWRGAAPIQRAVMNGDRTGGVTVMQMDEGLDTGNIILQKSVPIGPDTTAGEYHDALAEAASEALREYLVLAASSDGPVPSSKQPENATYASKIEKEEGRVDFTGSAARTHDRIRGLSPFPGAFTFLDGKRVKLLGSRIGRSIEGEHVPGEILGSGKDGLEVMCADGSLILTCLQPEGKGKMSGQSFANGIRSGSGKDILHVFRG